MMTDFIGDGAYRMNARLAVLALFVFPILVSAETRGHVESESRDASAAYIFTQNFIVGRTARECFQVLGRVDTPKSFVMAWQQRNAQYMSAATSYMNRRLVEAELRSGVAGRNEVASALNAAISKNGTGAVSDFFSKGDKQTVCTRAIGLMEKGIFDIDSRSPMFGELQALVNYVESP